MKSGLGSAPVSETPTPQFRAVEKSLKDAALSSAQSLLQHPGWVDDALALRDRLDALIDEALANEELQNPVTRWRKRWFGK